ncbi:hypothetical protein O6H91_02G053500 [Diphasiastrum complanatum]|uniref:Uncharacterized protein n=3 Tax=Diphasiastrum complanatum TaxID=34168 RepID=A0ACC2EFX7_DIPCM|nr:hypothetical protein O6H91_02G053500 [Diphasiastrum complanatum]KAJ7565248.1 hypothetical protein O6H91_02G053500 [Diphasiastrum complanatum]KAJ7565250.1 hypothetical protein O6H91_02G053500 [Diphasiastrum complanatum]
MDSNSVAVAVSSGKSASAVKWALKNLVSSEEIVTLLHVRTPVNFIPAPLGGNVHISQVSPEIVKAHFHEIEVRTSRLMKTFARLCDAHKVNSEILVVEANSIERALVEEISKREITRLVLGSSSHSIFTRTLIRPGLAAYVSRNAPDFCSVYIISKQRLSSMKKSIRRLESNISLSSSPSSAAELGKFLHTQRSSISSLVEDEVQEHDPSLCRQGEREHHLLRYLSLPADTRSADCVISRRDHFASSGFFNVSHVQERSYPQMARNEFLGDQNFSRISNPHQQRPEVPQSYEETESHHDSEWSWPDEMVEKLTWQLEHAYHLAKKAHEDAETEALKAEHDAILAAEKAKDAALQLEEVTWHVEALKALQLAEARAAEETRKLQEALAEVQIARRAAEEERRRRREAEFQSIQDEEERIAVTQALEQAQQQYRIYSFDEILAATDNLSEANRLGEGGYGVVYKGKLHHINVAIKVLKENASQGLAQFQHEVEVLRRIHHPHMVLLLGCCPEKGCLVYEFMANGSLEDRLECLGGTPPLPWYTRFRIAAEVAMALLFLHGSNPEPIVHRDLKPGNILLDRNFVGKLGDVGLARLIPESMAEMNSTFFLDSKPVGTIAYIDPEYYQTGCFGRKSDVYAFGVVLLRLLTGKPPVGLIKYVRDAFDSGSFPNILDQSAGDWPLEEATQVALLAVNCVDFSHKKRPDLETCILPILEGVREAADTLAVKNLIKQPNSKDDVPEMFTCPILREVMEDPVIAADGYTYEYAAIKQWLQEHDTSPLTNLPLPHMSLISNIPLRSVITHWQAAFG